MKRFSPSLLLAAAIVAGATACSDSTGSGQVVKPPAALNYVHLAATAAQPCADSVGTWFHKAANGSDEELALQFPSAGAPTDCSGETEDFIRLKLDRQALSKLPNGTPIADGDSVFISIVWAQGDSVLFHLQPTGLVFDPSHQAELKISFGETDQASDTTIVKQLAVWRQALPTDDFVKLSTTRLDVEQELEVKLNGFSRYAIAY
jgi:hypothetical protein